MDILVQWIVSNTKKLKRICISLFILAILALVVFYMFDFKKSTELIVRQSYFSGQMSCVEGNSLYFKGIDKIFKYSLTRDFYFNSDTTQVNGKMWEGDASDEDGIKITLSRNAEATISGYLKYQLPTNCDMLIKLHNDQKSDDGIKHNLVRNSVIAALNKTGPLFTAEAAKVTDVAKFRRMAEDQLTDGEYLTQTEKIEERISEDETDSTGKIIHKGQFQQYWVTSLKLDKNGQRIITKNSTFKEYGILVKQFDIRYVELDSTSQNQLNLSKKREMERVAKTTEAETEKQKALTEKARGDAMVAKERAEREVEKTRATIQAQQEKEVAEIQAQQRLNVAQKNKEAAKLEGDAILLKAEAESKANKLLVSAGLTPQERLEGEIKKIEAISKAIENTQQKWVPEIQSGSMTPANGNGGFASSIDAIAQIMYYNLSESMKNKTAK